MTTWMTRMTEEIDCIGLLCTVHIREHLEQSSKGAL